MPTLPSLPTVFTLDYEYSLAAAPRFGLRLFQISVGADGQALQAEVAMERMAS
jgi:hypothetical protein